MDHAKTLADILKYDDLARQSEQALLDSRDREQVSQVVTSAAHALLSEGDDQAELRLIRLADLLARLATEDAVRTLLEMLDGDLPDLRRAAGAALADVGEEHFELLAPVVREVLAEPSPGPVVEELALVLSETDHPDTIDLLLEMLAHRSPQVVVAALEVAGELGWDQRIWAALHRLTTDGRAAMVHDEDEGEVMLAISELATEVVDTLRALGRSEDE